MPHHCIVPLCTNHSGMPGLSFHRLPLHNAALLKQWLIKIRRENTPVSKHSRVCSAHFKGGKKSGDLDIPVIFAWTKPQRASLKRNLSKMSSPHDADVLQSVENILQEIVPSGEQPNEEHDNYVVESIISDFQSDEHEKNIDSFMPEKMDVATNTCYTCTYKDIGIQNATFMLHTGIQTVVDTDNASVQATVTTQDASTEMPKVVEGIGTMTDDLDMERPPFCIEAIKGDEKAVTFYTGFVSYLHLMVCFNFLGPAATTLHYNVQDSEKEATFMGRFHKLTPVNEFFLTLCRLRLGLREQDLAYRFQISQTTVSRIVTTWVNFMYYKFKEIPIWPSRQSVDYYMPDCFRSLYPKTRCIIDATEIYIQMPSNPTAQQLTFSNYKNHNTLKALIGITPSGAICFISDLYGGNISDKKLTKECGILKLLESGDSIMADRGFTIEDILPPGVSLNVPPRLNDTGQLHESERTSTRRIASVRIHVERAIERIKNYHILHDVPNTMHNNINQLFFVCALLTKFLPPLVQ